MAFHASEGFVLVISGQHVVKDGQTLVVIHVLVASQVAFAVKRHNHFIGKQMISLQILQNRTKIH